MAHLNPLFNRKPVPDEFLEGVGVTGMTKEEEYLVRERKLSRDGGDIRKFWNPKSKDGKLNPLYARKPVPDELIQDVGVTGMTKEQEQQMRERKMYDKNGVDIRRFSTSYDGGLAPQSDPFYGRKQVTDEEIRGIGDSGLSKAEEFENRENKAALFDLSSDPFQALTGRGHRGSVAAVASAGAADARRKSSANAASADAARATANVHGHGAHSGYTGEHSLPPIESARDSNIFSSTNKSAADNQYSYGPNTTTTTTTTTTTNSGLNQHGLYHDVATHDPDSVAPDERR